MMWGVRISIESIGPFSSPSITLSDAGSSSLLADTTSDPVHDPHIAEEEEDRREPNAVMPTKAKFAKLSYQSRA